MVPSDDEKVGGEWIPDLYGTEASADTAKAVVLGFEWSMKSDKERHTNAPATNKTRHTTAPATDKELHTNAPDTVSRTKESIISPWLPTQHMAYSSIACCDVYMSCHEVVESPTYG